MSNIYQRLAARLGPRGFSTDPDVLGPHLVEWRGRYRGTTPFLAMPETTAEVADLVRLCAETKTALTPQGGNTGLVGGQIPDGEVLLSLKRLNRIRALDPLDDSLTAEAGVVLARVQQAASDAGRLFPLSLGSQGSASIGGLISTNAGGVHVVRYGMMRDLVLGLEVVLADGTVLDGLSSLRKNNTGYDLKQLFIGAEGTLGIVTAATLKLFTKPAAHVTAAVGLMQASDALALLHRAKAATGALAAFEVMNRLSVDLAVKHIDGVRDPFAIAPAFVALLEFEGADLNGGLESAVEELLGAAMEENLIVDAALARSEAQRVQFWKLRETIPAAHKLEGAEANHDIAVPVSASPEFLTKAEAAVAGLMPGARIVAFGHLGDGNIHYTVLQPIGADPATFDDRAAAITQAVQRIAVDLGGSISAEHGVGVSRRDELVHYKAPQALALMKTLKAALDPHRIMNPRAMVQP
ncbi:MAG: FAD-binding oxidoreductase [Caulobacterales bacterium]|jgi:FAD/FMN-containing dehydrogenase